ncbi:decapping and exoribonuclease protein-like [Neocloeon triangulifer]|uniref:decapping and exoribonuclease protein-like n=1 Tax=Neocloeon triangulifer TaxID=2078957 RepID=UPI00286EC44D|nr:decapping and exoribonuclease protein-like [Neocloeon triangulifer]
MPIGDKNKYDLSVVDELLKVKDVVGWYTRNWDGDFCVDEKYVKYVHLPPDMDDVNFDLNRTHPKDKWKPYDCTYESIDLILQWIRANCKDQDGKPKRTKGTTYFCQFFTEQNRHLISEHAQNPDNIKYAKWSHVFERYLVSSDLGKKPDPSQPISDYEGFHCVYRSQIGEHSLLYGAEIDGLSNVDDLKNLNKAKLVELKVCKESLDLQSFSRHRLFKWWTQGILAKIDSVVVGYRNEEGFIRHLEELKLADMTERAKYVMKDAMDTDVYEFKWYPKEKNVSGIKLHPENNCNFLPEQFKEWLASA